MLLPGREGATFGAAGPRGCDFLELPGPRRDFWNRATETASTLPADLLDSLTPPLPTQPLPYPRLYN